MMAGRTDVETRRDIVYLALAGFFVTNAILAELSQLASKNANFWKARHRNPA